jgi:hypothetical protein
LRRMWLVSCFYRLCILMLCPAFVCIDFYNMGAYTVKNWTWSLFFWFFMATYSKHGSAHTAIFWCCSDSFMLGVLWKEPCTGFCETSIKHCMLG